MTPTGPIRDWRQLWHRIQAELTALDQGISVPMSSDAIRERCDRLLGFYVLAYHLKDALIKEGAVNKKAVEAAINSEADLALLADLANIVVKHSGPDPKHSPRSGSVPRIVGMHGDRPGAGGNWQLVLQIKHAGIVRDGLDCARGAVNAWQRTLINLQVI